MFTRTLGDDGPEASVIGFGAWAIGGWKWGGTDETEAVAAIRQALDTGMTLIDTAPVYGFGLSETLVGRAIASRPRDSVVVATKCGLVWERGSDTLHARSEGRSIYRRLDAASMREELHASLARLGTDHVDLYQTHWPDPDADMQEVAETLAGFRDEGLVRAVGFCNSDTGDLQAAAMHLDTDQERYSLVDREQDLMNLPVCELHGLGFLAYSPMAQGLLAGKFGAGHAFADGDLRQGNPRFAPAVLAALEAVLAPVKAIARRRETPLERLVLAWTLTRPGVSHVLAGTRTVEQAASNAAAGSMELDAEEVALISQAAAAWPGFESLAGRGKGAGGRA